VLEQQTRVRRLKLTQISLSFLNVVSDDDLRQRIIYQKTTTFLICGSVRQGEGGAPTLSYCARPLVDYGSITKTILLSSQSSARPVNISGSGAALERKPIIDINDLTEHVTKENPTDLDQGLGLLPEQESSSDLVPIKKDEDEEEMIINDPFFANLICGTDDLSDDEDMEDFEDLAFNLRKSLTVGQDTLASEPIGSVNGEVTTPKKKSVAVDKPPAGDKPLMGVVPLEGSKKRRAPASTSASDSTKSVPTFDPVISKKRKTPLPSITVEPPLSPVPVTAPSVAAAPPSARSAVLSTPKVTPLPAEVSAAPSVAPKAVTTTEHRNKEVGKQLHGHGCCHCTFLYCSQTKYVLFISIVDYQGAHEHGFGQD